MATRLAVQWGKSPSEIMASTSAKDFAYFHALYHMEPWGFKESAFLASVISNMAGKKIDKTLTANDFMK